MAAGERDWRPQAYQGRNVETVRALNQNMENNPMQSSGRLPA
jgi:hypothetical protein